MNIKCKLCEANVLVLNFTKNSNEEKNICFKCPYCSEDNIKSIQGEFFYSAYFKITNPETLESHSDLYVHSCEKNGDNILFDIRRHDK